MSERLEIEFPADPNVTRTLRQDLRTKLEAMQVAPESLDFVLLVVDEIVNNAIEHSADYRAAKGQLRIRIEPQGQDVMLGFEDPDVPGDVVDELATVLGGGFDDTPPLESERGRGLFLIAFNVQDLRVSRRPDGGMLLQGRFPDALA